MGFISDATRYAKRLASSDEPMDSEDELAHVDEHMDKLSEYIHNLRWRYVNMSDQLLPNKKSHKYLKQSRSWHRFIQS